MKKVLFGLMLVLFLVGCSEKDAEVEKAVENDDQKMVENEPKEEDSEENEQTDDGILTKIGQKINDPQTNSTVELLAMKEVNEIIDLDPIKLTIEDIKIVRISDIKNNDFRSYINQFTDKEVFEYIQIMYTMENTIDENVNLYYPIEHLVLNTGEQIDTYMNDIMLDPDNGGDFFGKVVKDSGISLIINDSNVNEIESIKLITGDVWRIDGDKIVGQIEKTYHIN